MATTKEYSSPDTAVMTRNARSMARQAIDSGDDGTNDRLASEVIRTNELQVWFDSQYLVGASEI